MENKVIIKVETGSRLYGTPTELSDTDFIGVFLPTKKELLGFTRSDYRSLGKVSKNDEGKNDGDAVDYVLHSLPKFLHLALKGNPNILELFFVNEGNIVEIDSIGRKLLKLAPCLIGKHMVKPYMGWVFKETRFLGRLRMQEVSVSTMAVTYKRYSHVVRLLHELKALLSMGKLVFPLPEAEEIKGIKEGRVSFDLLRCRIEDLVSDVGVLEGGCSFPEKPNFHAVENFLIETHEGIVRESKYIVDLS